MLYIAAVHTLRDCLACVITGGRCALIGVLLPPTRVLAFYPVGKDRCGLAVGKRSFACNQFTIPICPAIGEISRRSKGLQVVIAGKFIHVNVLIAVRKEGDGSLRIAFRRRGDNTASLFLEQRRFAAFGIFGYEPGIRVSNKPLDDLRIRFVRTPAAGNGERENRAARGADLIRLARDYRILRNADCTRFIHIDIACYRQPIVFISQDKAPWLNPCA